MRKVCPIIHIIGLIGSTRTWYTISKHIPQATHQILHHTPGLILLCCSIFDLSRFLLVGRFRGRFGNEREPGSFFLHFAYFFLPAGFFLSPGLATGVSFLVEPFLSASLGLGGMLLVIALLVCSNYVLSYSCIDSSISMMQSMRLFMHFQGFMHTLKCEGCGLHVQSEFCHVCCFENECPKQTQINRKDVTRGDAGRKGKHSTVSFYKQQAVHHITLHY